MPRNYKVYLEDILDSIKAVEEFTAGISYQEFCGDRKTFDAVARNLEIIGEASKKLPEDVRTKFPAVEWKKMASLRDILAHEYFRVNGEKQIARAKIGFARGPKRRKSGHGLKVKSLESPTSLISVCERGCYWN